MAKLYRENGSEISPCIISQVRYKLGLKPKEAKNSKSCSDKYWNETVKRVATIKSIPLSQYKTILK